MRTYIFTLDDRNATRLMNKRQSRDVTVANKIMLLAGAEPIYIKKKSESFFLNTDFLPTFIYFESLNEIPDNAYVFFEEPLSKDELRSAGKIVVFRWNRIYPSTNADRIDLNGFTKVKYDDFEGSSHDNITTEVYFNEKD